MTGKTIAAHLDGTSVERLGMIAEAEGRNASQLIAVATRLLLDMSPAARRALIAMDSSKPEDREFVKRVMGRAALKAREQLVAKRMPAAYSPLTNQPLDNESAIEAEAVAATRS